MGGSFKGWNEIIWVAVSRLAFRLRYDFNVFYLQVLIRFRHAVSLTLRQMQDRVCIGRCVFGLAPNAISLTNCCRACAAPVYIYRYMYIYIARMPLLLIS